MVMAFDPDDPGGGGGGGGGGGTGGGGTGGRTWVINATTDQVTFSAPPGVGVAIQVTEYAVASINLSDLWSLGSWCDAYGWPEEVEFFGGRLWWAATLAQPGTMWGSNIDNFGDHGISTPIEDDDAINATLNSRRLNTIRELAPLQSLVVLTSGGAWREMTAAESPITPSSVAFRPQVAAGASTLPSLLVDGSAVYATDRGYQVRDFSYTYEADGYAGSDLTAFAAHLVREHQIVDWDFQLVPYSAVWAVRDDGYLLSMTFKREHQVVGWCWHDTPHGVFSSVVTIPEGDGNVVYAIVERTINGIVVPMLERQALPTKHQVDWRGLDSSLTYDGRNTTETQVRMENVGNPDWSTELPVQITSDAPLFDVADEENVLVLGYGDEAREIRIRLKEFVDDQTMVGFLLGPAEQAGIWGSMWIQSWAMAVDVIEGLDHLNNMLVDIVGDAQLMGQQVPQAGKVFLDAPAVVVHVGFAYSCDVETLEVSIPNGPPVAGVHKRISKVDVQFDTARNVWVGSSFGTLEPAKARRRERYGQPPGTMEGLVDYVVSGEWGPNGKVCIRMGGGLPATLLSVSPSVDFGK